MEKHIDDAAASQAAPAQHRAGRKPGYRTEQRQLVMGCLDANADRYQTVDEIFGTLRNSGANIGRTTVYRTLEKLSAEGSVSKVVGAPGTSALYKRVLDADQGQLLCLECGRVFPLDCSMLSSFAEHVRAHHGFAIDQRKTVICGVCDECRRSDEESSEGSVHDELHRHDGCGCGAGDPGHADKDHGHDGCSCGHGHAHHED